VRKINKIVSSVLLFVVGTGLSLTTGNFIITTVVCFLLGLVLNRGGRKRPKKVVPETVRPQRNRYAQDSLISREPSAGRRCSSCGAMARPNIKYCEKCGSKIEMALVPSTRTDRPEYRPEYIWNNLERIQSENEAKYVTIVQDLLMTDQWGKYWSIGARTSQWYTYENGKWVVDQPTGTMRIMRRSSSILGTGQAFKATPATLRRPSRNTCDFCGAGVVPSDDFCINCGHRLVPRP
jgi:hypothetical protein